MKTEGHVQYNGGWKFYLTHQPSLVCEFADHRTCVLRSAEYDAKLSDADKAALAVTKAEQAANVDAAAADALKAAQTARINEAGRRKHEATRENGLIKANALAVAEKKCASKLADMTALYEAACTAARQTLDDETEEAINANITKQNEINATDFLALVLADEGAALEAKADAEQAAKDAEIDAENKDKANAKTAEDHNAAQPDENKEADEADAAQP